MWVPIEKKPAPSKHEFNCVGQFPYWSNIATPPCVIRIIRKYVYIDLCPPSSSSIVQANQDPGRNWLEASYGPKVVIYIKFEKNIMFSKYKIYKYIFRCLSVLWKIKFKHLFKYCGHSTFVLFCVGTFTAPYCTNFLQRCRKCSFMVLFKQNLY